MGVPGNSDLAPNQHQETLRFALGDTFGLRYGLRDFRFTLMLKPVAQSEAKGLRR